MSQVIHWVKVHSWLFGIFGLALLFRLMWLEHLPATFFVDEVLSGYLGRYLWLNGVDLYGNPRPLLYFNKFGDYYIILPMWLDGLSTFIFGVTRFATRFPTALIGALAVFPMFAITQRIFLKTKAGYLAALLLALVPWHVVLSRATTESIIELTVILTVVWLLLKAGDKGKKQHIWLLAALGFSLLSYVIYHTARVTVPLLWLGYALLFFKDFWQQKKLLFIAGVAILLLFSLTFSISRTEWGSGRFDQTSIFAEQSGVAIRMQEMTFNLGNDNILAARIFHNKVIGYSREFINQYITYFSLPFLFSAEAWLSTRYAVPETGLLYITILLLLVAYLLPSKKKLPVNRKVLLFIIWWLLIAPLPAALTVIESPNIRRSLAMVAPLLMIAAGGWYKSFFVGWKQLTLGLIFSILLAGEVILFSYLYVKQSDALNAIYRSDVQPEIARYIVENNHQANQFLVFDSYDFPLYYLFETQNFSPEWSKQFHFGLQIEQMDKVKPVEIKCAVAMPPDLLAVQDPDTLYVEPHFCVTDTQRFEKVDQINGVNQLLHYTVLRRLDAGEGGQDLLL